MKQKWLTLSLRGLRQNRWRADRQAILDFNRSLLLFADPDALMASISSRLKEIFSPDCIIILRAADAGIFTLVFSSGCEANDLKSIQLTQRDRLAKWLQTNEEALIVGRDPSLSSYLSQAEREMLETLNVKVCVPLLAMNRLTGIMMLCSRNRDWKIDQDHIALLEMLVS
ncbi:MAG: GAF domain-containing protein, partial [Blastocatellia bacterium]